MQQTLETYELKKANEWIIDGPDLPKSDFLFDEFWREGELALMFGPSGSGKSILATQIAEAVARGRRIDGFRMPDRGTKVLYVDLAGSNRRFRQRYCTADGTKQYSFSERLYRQAPPPDADLVKWLRERVSLDGFRVAVIDDLNCLSQKADGIRETLAAMRGIRRISDETNVSILVIARSRPNRDRLVSEIDLMRSRILCDVADSVFTVGFDPRNDRQRLLVQLRSWAAPLYWTWRNAPRAVIEPRSDDGFLAFLFDDRFAKQFPDEMRRLIQDIKWRVDAGASYKCIADEFGMSKTRVFRLAKLWTPDMHPPPLDEFDEHAVDAEEDDIAAEEYLKEVGMDTTDFYEADGTAEINGTPETEHPEPDESGPFAAMKRSYDRRGQVIFIEHEDDNGRPTLWYGYNKAGRFSRFERTLTGISIQPYEGLALPP